MKTEEQVRSMRHETAQGILRLLEKAIEKPINFLPDSVANEVEDSLKRLMWLDWVLEQ